MNIFLLGLLAELGQNTLCRFRMQERNHEVLSTFAGSLVDELETCSLALSQRVSYVLYVESNVVNTASSAVLLDELGNRGLRASRLQKLDLHLAYLEESGADFLVCHFLDRITLVPGKELKEGRSLFDRGYCDTQMLNVCGFHKFKV